MNIYRPLLIVFLFVVSTSTFANQTFTSCDDYEIYQDLMEQDLLTPDLIAVTKAMGKICTDNSDAKFSITLTPQAVTKEEPKSSRKYKIKFNADGSYQNNSSGEFMLVSTSITVSTLLNELNKFSLSITGQVKMEDDENFKEGALNLQNDRLINNGKSSVFAVVDVSTNDAKKQRVIAMGIIGVGHDFDGDYFGTNDGGEAIKLSTAIGAEYSDIDDVHDNQIISSTRLKIIKAVTETIKIEFVTWFKTTVYSKEYGVNLGDFETLEELVLKFKQDRIAEFFGGGSDFHFVIKFSHAYQNEVPNGVDHNDVRITFGIEYLW